MGWGGQVPGGPHPTQTQARLTGRPDEMVPFCRQWVALSSSARCSGCCCSKSPTFPSPKKSRLEAFYQFRFFFYLGGMCSVSHCYQGAHKAESKTDCSHHGTQVPAGALPYSALGRLCQDPKNQQNPFVVSKGKLQAATIFTGDYSKNAQ